LNVSADKAVEQHAQGRQAGEPRAGAALVRRESAARAAQRRGARLCGEAEAGRTTDRLVVARKVVPWRAVGTLRERATRVAEIAGWARASVCARLRKGRTDLISSELCARWPRRSSPFVDLRALRESESSRAADARAARMMRLRAERTVAGHGAQEGGGAECLEERPVRETGQHEPGQSRERGTGGDRTGHRTSISHKGG